MLQEDIILSVQNESFRAEVDSLRLKLRASSEEIMTLRTSLEESRASGDRLHQESEVVTQNVNQWIHEQKYVVVVIFLCVLFFFL